MSIDSSEMKTLGRISTFPSIEVLDLNEAKGYFSQIFYTEKNSMLNLS